MTTRIGIIGSGDVGKALGRGFAARGHEVRLGTRTPEREDVQAWVKENGDRASAGSPADAAAFGEVLVLATNWGGTENALKLAGAGNFAGKVVIDATNPLVFREDGPPSLALANTDSGGEQVQRWLPDAKVVKAFNIVNNQDMVDPGFQPAATMFIGGNDADAKKTVTGILHDFGWKDVMDLGGIEAARVLEPLCIFWVNVGIARGDWGHAVKLVVR